MVTHWRGYDEATLTGIEHALLLEAKAMSSGVTCPLCSNKLLADGAATLQNHIKQFHGDHQDYESVKGFVNLVRSNAHTEKQFAQSRQQGWVFRRLILKVQDLECWPRIMRFMDTTEHKEAETKLAELLSRNRRMPTPRFYPVPVYEFLDHAPYNSKNKLHKDSQWDEILRILRKEYTNGNI